MLFMSIPIWRWWWREWGYNWCLKTAGITNLILKNEYKTQICKHRGTNKFLAYCWPSNRSGLSCSMNWVPNLSLGFVFLNLRKRGVCLDSCPDCTLLGRASTNSQEPFFPRRRPKEEHSGSLSLPHNFHQLPSSYFQMDNRYFDIVSSLYFVGHKIWYSRLAN